MYKKPTAEGIEIAMNDGWSRADAERGYCEFDFNQTGLMEIERIDACYDLSSEDDVTDEDCAREAERSGYCKIIPVEELPNPFVIWNEDRRWFGWVDTPENRKAIREYCER